MGENGRQTVGIDGDDGLCAIHAGGVLRRAGDAKGEVPFGAHDLAGLANLAIVSGIARVYRAAAGAQRAAQKGRKALEFAKSGFSSHAFAACHDDFGLLQRLSAFGGDGVQFL